MDSTSEVIGQSQVLVDAMGFWPTFHDAHLLRARCVDGKCSVVLHVFEMTDEVDGAGYFILIKHHLVTLDLLDVSSSSMPEGYDGDILDSIEARRSDSGAVVEFESAVDPDRSWQVECREARISDVVPCDRRGNAI